MDASIISHYREQVSIDVKGSCFQEHLLNLLWPPVKVTAQPICVPLFRQIIKQTPQPTWHPSEYQKGGTSIADGSAQAKNSKWEKMMKLRKENNMKTNPRVPDAEFGMYWRTATGHLQGAVAPVSGLSSSLLSWLRLLQKDSMALLPGLFPFSNVKLENLHTCKMTYVKGYSLRHCLQ